MTGQQDKGQSRAREALIAVQSHYKSGAITETDLRSSYRNILVKQVLNPSISD